MQASTLPFVAAAFLGRTVDRLAANFARSVQEFEPNFRWMGLGGAVCFLFYWVVWKYCFVQVYENLPLRLVGATLAVGLGLSDRWPPGWRERYLNPYAYFTLLYVFPFFFTYMLLQNQGSPVWGMSALVACFLTILLVDVWNLICMQLLGTALAAGLYAATAPAGQDLVAQLHPRELMLFVFLFVMGSIFNIRAEIMRREKSRAMLLMGARMAHELRTPLAGIKIGLAGLGRLIERHPEASGQLQMFKRQIIDQANHAGTLIDMLLLNANREHIVAGPGRRCFADSTEVLLARKLLETTLANFPFVSEAERELVRLRGDFRFYIRGQRDLLICVFYNLLKNAIYAVHRAGRRGPGCIEIIAAPAASGGYTRILVRDCGAGIAAGDLPRIFDQFYTTKPGCDGIGVGLWNTRHILQDHGGEIRCRSRPGQGTEFELSLPPVSPPLAGQLAQGSGQSAGRTTSRTLDSA